MDVLVLVISFFFELSVIFYLNLADLFFFDGVTLHLLHTKFFGCIGGEDTNAVLIQVTQFVFIRKLFMLCTQFVQFGI